MVKRGLAAKNFEQNVVGKVSKTEAEIQKYYEKHKILSLSFHLGHKSYSS